MCVPVRYKSAAELTKAANAAFVTLALSRSGAEDRRTQPTNRPKGTNRIGG